MIKELIVNALRLEVSRKLGISHIKALQLDLEEDLSKVADAVALAVKQDIQRYVKVRPHETENLKDLKNCAENERTLQPVFFMVTGEKDLFDAGNDVDQSVPRSEYKTGKAKGILSRKEIGYKFDDPREAYKQQEPMHDEKHQNKHARSIEKNKELMVEPWWEQ